MKKLFSLLAIVLLLGTTVQFAHASAWDQSVYNADLTLSGNVGIHPNLSGETISSITFLAKDNNSPSCGHTDSFYVIISPDGTSISHNNGFTLQSSTAGYQPYTVNYSPPIPGNEIYTIAINVYATYVQGNGCDGYYPSMQIEAATGISDPYTPNFFSTDSNYAPTIFYNGYTPPPVYTLGFTSPQTGGTLKYNSDQTFTGTCVNNGPDQLALVVPNGSAGPFEVPDPNNPGYTYFKDANYNIDCVNNTWTATATVGMDSEMAYIIDKNNPDTVNGGQVAFMTSKDGSSFATINFSYPFIMDFSSPDFDNWFVDVFFPPLHTQSGFQVIVNYGPATSAPFLYQDKSLSLPLTSTGTYSSTLTIPKNQALAPGQYKAMAYLQDQGGNAVADSVTTLTFTVTAGAALSSPNNLTPADLSTTGDQAAAVNISCNQSNVIVQGLCNVMVYLFIPKQSDFTQFQGLYTTIQSKPPFGYFTSTQAAISGLALATPAVTLSGISMLTGFFSPIKTGFTLLIFILCGLWIYHRITKFNFQQ